MNPLILPFFLLFVFFINFLGFFFLLLFDPVVEFLILVVVIFNLFVLR